MSDKMVLANDYPVGALAAIGNTPLIRLKRSVPDGVQIYAKAEYLQPGGSIKDRVALSMIMGARKAGLLHPGQSVVEMTSGNMGAGLAVVCNVLGHPFIAVMPEGNSPERAQMMRAFGAAVVLVKQVDGQPGQVTGADIAAAAEEAQRIARDRGAYYTDQFNNPFSLAAHEQGTGPELWRALGDSIAGFVACVGSGGTFLGVSRFLKQKKASIFCAAVEPVEAMVLSGQAVRNPRHVIQGTGYGMVPPKWQDGLMDQAIGVGDAEVMDWKERLAHLEGLYVGYSAAANVCAAVRLAQSGLIPKDGVVATVLCDSGFKYGVTAT